MSEAEAQDSVEQPSEEILAQQAEASPKSGNPADTAFEQLGQEDFRSQLQQAEDRVLRTQAELENFRKRTRRDMDEQRRYANLQLVNDLLPAIENLDRAIEAADKDESASGLAAGVKMVADQVRAILSQHSCVRIEAEGRPFDPNVHEAIAQEPSDDVPAGHVTRVVSVGYQLHDRVIRPAQVMVSTGPSPTQPNAPPEETPQ
jgi:molecular chaperone GrpE